MFSKKSVKIIIGFVVIVLIGWVAFYGLPKYQNWQKWRNIKKQAEEFEMKQKELEALIKADTYGGKTPQETLEMFISAVEVGNYELASKYFVVEKQGEELAKLKRSPKDNINNVIKLLKQINNSKGEYSENKQSYSLYDPVAVDFILYHFNLWKISEI